MVSKKLKNEILELLFAVILYLIVAWVVRLFLLWKFTDNFWLSWLVGLLVGITVIVLAFKKVQLFVKNVFHV